MKYYITTSIPYVNGEPHLGHAMEFIMADVLARFARSAGKNTLFSTGTDEHGAKIAEKAADLGLDPKALVDKMSGEYRSLIDALNVLPDRFIRTTDKNHAERVQLVWKSIAKDIYKNQYVGWYCVGDEEFFSETIVKENGGVCPDHNRPYERVEEENYFFRLSKYNEQIKQAIEDNSFKIVPSTRRNEILALLESGLDDISISRPAEKVDWGIPVPGDAKQVIYVWFDALLNYITVLGYPEHADFQTFWPADVQVIGKGISRFHGAIWPGILLSLGLALPKDLYVHGYVNVDGKKMSKSLGNSVPPMNIIDRYGSDAFRYYFLRHIPSYEDGDFSWSAMDAAYNNELANELGNAVQRVAAMIIKYQKGVIGDVPEPGHDMGVYLEAIEDYRFDRALDEVWDQVRGLNQLIDMQKPWKVAKTDDTEHLKSMLAEYVSDLLQIAEMLAPFLPTSATAIQNIFKGGVVNQPVEILFPRREDESVEATEPTAEASA